MIIEGLINAILSSFDLSLGAILDPYSIRMMCAALTSFLICLTFGPRVIQTLYAFKVGQPIRKAECPTLGQLHAKKEDTPTMGGVLILLAMLASLFLWMDLSHLFTKILLMTTIVLGILGGCDDVLKVLYRNNKGVSARIKLLVQALLSIGVAFLLFGNFEDSSTLVIREWVKPGEGENVISQTLFLREYASRLYFPFIEQPIWQAHGFFEFFLMTGFYFFVITGASNAVNLTDGLDGLAAGSIAIAAAALAAIAFLMNHTGVAAEYHLVYVQGSGEIAIYLSALVGAALGFLWYNCYPAQVFMGDVGSLSLGGILGVAAVLLKKELLFGVIGGIFVLEALSVIMQVISYRYRGKKRVFLCAPLHHHYEYKGYPETKVVVRFWLMGLLFALFGLLSLRIQWNG